jgi:hypothetical protein
MREIIIIKENIPQIKDYLDKQNIGYEIYQENQKNIFSDYGAALQDPERQREAQELENSEEEDIINED